MSLLFAFGVMNLLWVAGISAFVLLEKITPANKSVSRLSGLLFIGWAAWIAFSS
jgi:predicted metal-binding membrane protein